MDKCIVCNRRYEYFDEKKGCPCHLNTDDELCDFAFELINIKEYDAKIRENAIEAYRKNVIQSIEDIIGSAYQGYALQEYLEQLKAEQLKENNNE